MAGDCTKQYFPKQANTVFKLIFWHCVYILILVRVVFGIVFRKITPIWIVIIQHLCKTCSTNSRWGQSLSKCLKSEQGSLWPPPRPPSWLCLWRGVLPRATIKLPLLAAIHDHKDVTPLTVLFSVLALSLMERTPESIGEETVQSIREGGVASVEPESVMEVGAESTAASCVG